MTSPSLKSRIDNGGGMCPMELFPQPKTRWSDAATTTHTPALAPAATPKPPRTVVVAYETTMDPSQGDKTEISAATDSANAG